MLQVKASYKLSESAKKAPPKPKKKAVKKATKPKTAPKVKVGDVVKLFKCHGRSEQRTELLRSLLLLFFSTIFVLQKVATKAAKKPTAPKTTVSHPTEIITM